MGDAPGKAPGGGASATLPGRAARSISLAPGEGPRRRLLAGPPETGALKSGLVTLEPGAAVGEHDTGSNEEVLKALHTLERDPELRASLGKSARAFVEKNFDLKHTAAEYGRLYASL